MKSISLFFTGAVIVAGIFAYADESQNLLNNGNAADGLNNWKNVPKVAADGPNGAKCFEVTNSREISSLEFIPVDTNSEYRLSGWFKSGNNKENVVYLGLLQFDANKKLITSTSVNALDQSETVLAVEAKAGDTVIKINDASKWEQLLKAKRLVIVFGADDSGEYKDLPNYRYCSVSNLEKKGDIWEATLRKPLAESFTANTKVRAHWASDHYLYVFGGKKNFADWTKCGNVVKPESKFGAENNFWHGTKYVQVLLLANDGQNNGETLQFGNIILEKVELKK